MSDLLFSKEILPKFSKIDLNNISSAITQIINSNNHQLNAIKQSTDWDSFVIAIEEMSIELSNAWAPVKHLNSVVANDELRSIYESVLQDIIQYSLIIEQDEKLFNNYKNILENNKQLNSAQKILLENKIRDFKLSGVDLPEDKKNEFKQLSSEISTLANKFNNNVLDCTDQWTYHITDENLNPKQVHDILAGIPQDIIDLASTRCKKTNQNGWIFGLDAPTYLAVMKYAKNRDVRANFHYAYATRASTHGPHDEKFDNEDVMYELLTKKYQLAKLLGFDNYAQYSLATKMVKDPKVVIDFLNNLVAKAKKVAENDWQELQLFAKRFDNIDDLKPWDIAYYTELQRNELYNLPENELKAYFPLTKVLSGFITIIDKLYNVKLEIHNEADVWHPDVSCYKVVKNSQTIGYVYIDLFARLKKRNGAWMDECRVRCFTDKIQQIPVAYLTCNFTPPGSDGIALLTHVEVTTLFHEFGHCLHHLLTKVDYPSISGINGVPWDAVELPSQFHEHWCWSKESIPYISGHFKTGEPLPEKYLKQLIKQKNYQAGLFLIRQLIFGLFDFRLHLEFHPEKDRIQIENMLDEIREQLSVLPYAEYDHFPHSFSHIFAGGYAAGYYSYLWAEVLSANCFDKFKKTNIFDQDTSLDFLEKILSKGGSIDINQAMHDFCQGEIKIEPLLDQYGINKAN